MTPLEIHTALASAGLSQSRAAAMLGVHSNTFSRWAAGSSSPNRAQADALRALARSDARTDAELKRALAYHKGHVARIRALLKEGVGEANSARAQGEEVSRG